METALPSNLMVHDDSLANMPIYHGMLISRTRNEGMSMGFALVVMQGRICCRICRMVQKMTICRRKCIP